MCSFLGVPTLSHPDLAGTWQGKQNPWRLGHSKDRTATKMVLLVVLSRFISLEPMFSTFQDTSSTFRFSKPHTQKQGPGRQSHLSCAQSLQINKRTRIVWLKKAMGKRWERVMKVEMYFHDRPDQKRKTVIWDTVMSALFQFKMIQVRPWCSWNEMDQKEWCCKNGPFAQVQPVDVIHGRMH